MKRLYSLAIALLCLSSSYSQTELILCTTGYGFDRNASNGINPDIWTYIQKWTSLTHNSQDASVTAVRLHVQWEQYEPTLGNYQGAKLVQAVQAILGLKSGMKIALHFAYQRPGSMNDSYTATVDIARLSNGDLAQEGITYTLPSMYSQTMRDRFYAFVDDALDNISSYYSSILYVQMGNGSAEEFVIPVVEKSYGLDQAFYESRAEDSWRTEYLPCRYPGQSTVTWNGSTHNISSAPTYPYYPSTYNWDTEHGREYHRFAAWGLMRFYKGFRDVVKAHSNNLKVLYFISDFGNVNGNAHFMHSSTLPMGMQEFDGIYTSDGVGPYDGVSKIRAVDIMKGTNPNKIAAIEYDPDDLGQVYGVNNINPNIASEWMPRAFKHGVNYIHFAMHYPDVDINLLAPVLADLRSNYVNGSYTPPSRQSPVNVNVYPTVFTGTHLFAGTYNTYNGSNWSTTDNNPVSINMIDEGYWQNIWNCSGSPDPCAFTVSASSSNNTPTGGASITLTASCSGQCTGVSYSWSGNGISGTSSTNTFNAPTTPGTYTYTLTGSKSGCSNKTSNVVITVPNGETSFNQCLESESMSGTGAITSDPNASNGDTRGEENSYNHYVDYAVTSVPAAGTYSVTLTYYSSSAPIVSVAVNGGTAQTVNLPNSGSWNIVKTTQTFNVTLSSGSNTIRILGTGGGSCRQDKICVSGTGSGCSSTPSAPSLSASLTSITSGGTSTLSASGCSGGTITWSNGLGNGTSKTVSPTSTTTYTATCTVDGCTSSNGSVTVTVTENGGPFSQCLESESMSGTGAITSDPNASNGDTRGEENNYNHYVDYAVTGVPSAGTYNVTLTYYSSSAPSIGVSINGGSASTINLANSGSWNIVHTTHTFTVTLASGSNTIRIVGTGGGSCRQDKICIANGSASVLGIDPAEIITDKNFKVYPNPGKGIFETSFFLQQGKKATIVVTDFVGRLIYRQSVTGKGLHKERIDLTNKASGTLLLQLIKQEGVEVKKIRIVR